VWLVLGANDDHHSRFLYQPRPSVDSLHGITFLSSSIHPSSSQRSFADAGDGGAGDGSGLLNGVALLLGAWRSVFRKSRAQQAAQDTFEMLPTFYPLPNSSSSGISGISSNSTSDSGSGSGTRLTDEAAIGTPLLRVLGLVSRHCFGRDGDATTLTTTTAAADAAAAASNGEYGEKKPEQQEAAALGRILEGDGLSVLVETLQSKDAGVQVSVEVEVPPNVYR
jgi:hypothetical protein